MIDVILVTLALGFVLGMTANELYRDRVERRRRAQEPPAPTHQSRDDFRTQVIAIMIGAQPLPWQTYSDKTILNGLATMRVGCDTHQDPYFHTVGYPVPREPTPLSNPWQSCALWPAGTIGQQCTISRDTHPTKEQAEAVCRMLERDGLGGEGRTFPIRTWPRQLTDEETTAWKESQK